MKKIVSTVLTLAIMFNLFVATSTQSYAAEEEGTEGLVVEESVLTHDLESTVTVYPRTRGVYMLSGSGTLTQVGAGKVGVAGSTTATMIVSSLKVSATLQRYVSGSWVYVNDWSNTLYNANYVSLYKIQSVTPGYYYRVLGNHWAYTDWTQSATSGIWIS